MFFDVGCSACGVFPFNPNWVNEHAELFAISRPLHDPAAAAHATGTAWPASLSGEQLFQHLLGLARENGESKSFVALDPASAVDTVAPELNADAGLLWVWCAVVLTQ